jgi:ABC-type sugar transport system substrate-binding protein
MFKKLMAGLVVLMLLAGILGTCALAADGKAFTIGYLGWDVAADWNTYTLGGLLWGAEQKGCEVIVLDAKLDAEKQINQAEELISKQVDFIAMFPVTPESGATITRMANEAGIPITVENTFLPDDGSAGEIVGEVACRYNDIGYAAIKYAAEKYPGCKLLYVTGGLGLGVTEIYKIGVQEALAEVGDLVTLVGEVNGEFVTEASYNVTQDFITSGKSEFDVVFAQNDAQTKGVYNALKEAGLEHIPILSTGGAPEGYEMLTAIPQQEAANMTAPANLQGLIQFKYIWDYLNGNPMTEKRTPLPIIPVDLDNIDAWIKWEDMEAGYQYVVDNIGAYNP